LILQDELLRLDGASANDVRLKAVGGFRAHQNDGSDGEHEHGVQQFPAVIRSFKALHSRGQEIEVRLRKIHSVPPKGSLGNPCGCWTSGNSGSEHRVHKRGWQSSLASPILS